ncbi:MAG: YihY/virulence factor BrkB family protein [Mobilicoccus sp.]|nr:YihY/virulence factor BrkB family protein [Mobilicoccus sp.]
MTEDEGTSSRKAQTAPPPDASFKPDSPTEITAPKWRYTFKKSVMEFMRDGCMDAAAALTYFSVLSLFPALLAMVSMLGVFGQGQQTVDTLMGLASDFVPSDVLSLVEPVVASMVASPAAGWTLLTGVLVALWSASNYVNAFSRAMNRIYEVDEGRPIWKARPLFVLLTLVILALIAVIGVGLAVSGPVARTIGDYVGLGDTAVLVWDTAKWPVILGLVILIVALLYYVTPNVQQPKFRWISVGATIAIALWLVVSAGFGFYVANFGNYNATYGSLGGVIIFLLWLWITNNALLFGAEIDAELERSRQLQAGIKAEETLQLPPRDTTQSDKAAAKRAEVIERGRQLRLDAEAAADHDSGSTAVRDD